MRIDLDRFFPIPNKSVWSFKLLSYWSRLSEFERHQVTFKKNSQTIQLPISWSFAFDLIGKKAMNWIYPRRIPVANKGFSSGFPSLKMLLGGGRSKIWTKTPRRQWPSKRQVLRRWICIMRSYDRNSCMRSKSYVNRWKGKASVCDVLSGFLHGGCFEEVKKALEFGEWKRNDCHCWNLRWNQHSQRKCGVPNL